MFGKRDREQITALTKAVDELTLLVKTQNTMLQVLLEDVDEIHEIVTPVSTAVTYGRRNANGKTIR